MIILSRRFLIPLSRCIAKEINMIPTLLSFELKEFFHVDLLYDNSDLICNNSSGLCNDMIPQYVHKNEFMETENSNCPIRKGR